MPADLTAAAARLARVEAGELPREVYSKCGPYWLAAMRADEIAMIDFARKLVDLASDQSEWSQRTFGH